MESSRFEVIGAAFDLTSRIRGCRTAPQVLRDEGLLQWIKHVEKLKALEDIDVSIKGIFRLFYGAQYQSIVI